MLPRSGMGARGRRGQRRGRGQGGRRDWGQSNRVIRRNKQRKQRGLGLAQAAGQERLQRKLSQVAGRARLNLWSEMLDIMKEEIGTRKKEMEERQKEMEERQKEMEEHKKEMEERRRTMMEERQKAIEKYQQMIEEEERSSITNPTPNRQRVARRRRGRK